MNGERQADVIVIGGGFAGVTAARELGQKGLEVLLIEARDRLGGRTWYEKDRIAGFDVEMGGGWLGAAETYAIDEVKRYGVALRQDHGVPGRMIWRSAAGIRRSILPVPFDQLADLERAIFRMGQIAARIAPDAFADGADLSDLADLEVPLPAVFEDLNLPAETRGVLEGWWAGISSASWSEMSALLAARLLAASGGTFMSFTGTVMLGPRFENGTGELIDAMIGDSGATVVLDCPVRKIAQQADRVTVETDRGIYTTGAVICTVPVNVLGKVAFEPPLNAVKSAAIATGHAGRGYKLWMVARNVNGGVFSIGAPGPFNHLFTVDERDDLALLVAFGEGSCPDTRDLGAIEARLKEYLPNAQLVAADAHDWLVDEFAEGTWACYPAGFITRFERALREPHGMVVFAGADISEERPGYIDGAIASGIKAAAQVSAKLRRDSGDDRSKPGRIQPAPLQDKGTTDEQDALPAA